MTTSTTDTPFRVVDVTYREGTWTLRFLSEDGLKTAIEEEGRAHQFGPVLDRALEQARDRFRVMRACNLHLLLVKDEATA